MTRLLVGFDSAWTAGNSGGLVGTVCQGVDGYEDLGNPVPANFQEAGRTIRKWQDKHGPSETIILIDQPTVVRNTAGQRPVKNLAASPVSLRYGGMQPANTARMGMFDANAPVWPFLQQFGGPTDPLSQAKGTQVFETYPVLAIIALGWTLPDTRPTGRLPKYNPARRTFSQEDWNHLCALTARQFSERGLENIAAWINSKSKPKPTKRDQDGLDACLCLLVAINFAEGKSCLMVGRHESGSIIVPYSSSLRDELVARCIKTTRDPDAWVKILDQGLQAPANKSTFSE